MTLKRTPSQTVGPFFHLGLDWLNNGDLAAPGVAGERIAISGTVRDGEGNPVPDAVLEFWQADAAGRYAHPEDQRAKDADPRFFGFARVATDGEGRFRLETVKPGRVPGRGNTLQAPHILVAVFMRGLLRHAFTRIYFADEEGNAADPVLALVDAPARRRTLVAERQSGTAEYRWDIAMQGENETVFFEC
jgi:protocatechuate 3,4-dioxygenase alpha subunit